MSGIRWVVMVFIVLTVLLFCSKPTAQTDKMQIATSIFPIYDMVRNVVGDKADVFFVVPIGANPHTYEPVPSEVQRMERVNVCIGIHPEFDGWMQDYIPVSARVLFLQEKIDDHKLEESAHPSHETEGGDHHPHNPHIWLSVHNAKAIVSQIAEMMTALDEQNSSQYQSQAQEYLGRLDRLDVEIDGLWKEVEHKRFIQWHPAWDYFAHDYGLEIVGTIEHGHGDQPSVREFKSLVDEARRKHVKVVVIGLNLESSATQALVDEIAGTLIRLDTIGDPEDEDRASYIQLMRHNARLLARAFNP
jgi:zinc transport system substrate-binding protein